MELGAKIIKYYFLNKEVQCSAFRKQGHEAELKDAKHKGVSDNFQAKRSAALKTKHTENS